LESESASTLRTKLLTGILLIANPGDGMGYTRHMHSTILSSFLKKITITPRTGLNPARA